MKPHLALNCAAISPNLVEATVFGHAKGAFTGALSARAGYFEDARDGTLFLDEIGELPLELQAKLLRVLENGEYQGLSSTQSRQSHARVIAATNRDLGEAAAAGSFRSDLFYRLNVFPIAMPPLRQRREDIPILVEYFAARYAARFGKRFRSIEKSSMERILGYGWPGNVRELQNVIERAAILSEGDVLRVDEPLIGGSGAASPSPPGAPLPDALRETERRRIEEALAQSAGRVSGARGAAARLGIPSTTLESRIKRLGIDKYRFR